MSSGGGGIGKSFWLFCVFGSEISRYSGLIVSNDSLEFSQSPTLGIMVAFLMKTLPFILFLLPNLFPLTTLFFVVGFSLNFEKLVSADLDYCPCGLICRDSEFELPLSQNLCIVTALATLLDLPFRNNCSWEWNNCSWESNSCNWRLPVQIFSPFPHDLDRAEVTSTHLSREV